MKKSIKENLPVIVRVDIDSTEFNMDAVDAEIYCVNNTKYIFSIATKSESFTTIDEETGEAAQHGSDPIERKLLPGESSKIAEVKGWEWDGHVGIEIFFRKEDDTKLAKRSYDFKSSTNDFIIPSSGLAGRIISPAKY